MAAAVMTPSGAPPDPMTACTPVPITAAAMPAERSPSPISRMRAPAARISAISFSWRGRSSTITTRSSTPRSSRRAMFFRLSATGASRSTACLQDGPDDDLLHVAIGSVQQAARSEAASTVMRPGAPVAQRLVPSRGSTAMSTSGTSAHREIPRRLSLRCTAWALHRARLRR